MQHLSKQQLQKAINGWLAAEEAERNGNDNREQKLVEEAVRRLRAVRQTSRECQMSTTRSRSLVLRSLPDHLLVMASEMLDGTGADNGTNKK